MPGGLFPGIHFFRKKGQVLVPFFPGGGLPYRKDGGVPRKLGNFAHLLIVVYAEFFITMSAAVCFR